MEVQPWVLWVVATILAVFIPAGVIGIHGMFAKDGEDGGSKVRESIAYPDWADELTDQESLVLATLVFRCQMRQIYDKEIDSIV